MKIRNSIHNTWNDGPNLKKLDKELQKKALAPNERAKEEMLETYQMSIARNSARSVALHDLT